MRVSMNASVTGGGQTMVPGCGNAAVRGDEEFTPPQDGQTFLVTSWVSIVVVATCGSRLYESAGT